MESLQPLEHYCNDSETTWPDDGKELYIGDMTEHDVAMEAEPSESHAQDSPGPGESDVGPVRPTDNVRNELATFLEADRSRLGQVYRALQRGLDADAIAEELEVTTSNFVWNYERMIKALLDGNLPAAPTV